MSTIICSFLPPQNLSGDRLQSPLCCLFKFYRADRLRRNIHKYSVDTLDLVCDAVADRMEQGIRNFLYGSRHSVRSIDRADDGCPALVALSILNTVALQNIGIDSALSEELDALKL